MSAWYEFKRFLEQAGAISMDALHVIAGVILFLAISLALRRPVSTWPPWLALVGVALLNELIDVSIERWPSPGMQVGEAAKDVALTILLPVVILLTARYAPKLYDRGNSEEPQPNFRRPTAS